MPGTGHHTLRESVRAEHSGRGAWRTYARRLERALRESQSGAVSRDTQAALSLSRALLARMGERSSDRARCPAETVKPRRAA